MTLLGSGWAHFLGTALGLEPKSWIGVGLNSSLELPQGVIWYGVENSDCAGTKQKSLNGVWHGTTVGDSFVLLDNDGDTLKGLTGRNGPLI